MRTSKRTEGRVPRGSGKHRKQDLEEEQKEDLEEEQKEDREEF